MGSPKEVSVNFLPYSNGAQNKQVDKLLGHASVIFTTHLDAYPEWIVTPVSFAFQRATPKYQNIVGTSLWDTHLTCRFPDILLTPRRPLTLERRNSLFNLHYKA